METLAAEREATDARRSAQGFDDARAQLHRSRTFMLAIPDRHDSLSAQHPARATASPPLPPPPQAHSQSEDSSPPPRSIGDDDVAPVLRDM